MKLNPYLIFDGQCAEAFRLYESVLGGKIEAMMTHAGTPMAGQLSEEWGEKILHACLSVGDSMLMGSDSPAEHYERPQGGYVSISIDDVARGQRIFDTLAENGRVNMPFEKTFWAERFGMLVDRFGTPWMISCGQPS